MAELRFGFADSQVRARDVPEILQAARWAHRRWLARQRVLIRCQAGLNRSGLVTALVLMLAGLTPAAAISEVRKGRAPVALFNNDFVDWLVENAPAQLPPRVAVDDFEDGICHFGFGDTAEARGEVPPF